MMALRFRRISKFTRFLSSGARTATLLATVVISLIVTALPVCAMINNGENASDLFGQFTSTTLDTTPNWTQSTANNAKGSVNSLGFSHPKGSALDELHHQLFVVDSGNNRVLVYNLNTDNSISSASGGHTPAFVLGQANFTSSSSALTQSGLNFPIDVAVDPGNNRLYVADFNNVRVLIFNTSSIANSMNASNVLGQANFTSNGAAATQSGMNGPNTVAVDLVNNRLFVGDSGSFRTLVFNTSSITNGMNASNVLGQANYTNNTYLGATQSGTGFSCGVAFDPVNNRLFVDDSSDQRILVFDTSSITNGMNASSRSLTSPNNVEAPLPPVDNQT